MGKKVDKKLSKRDAKPKTSASKGATVKQPNSPTVRLAPCTCASTFQDEKYGPGIRVHNLAKRTGQIRCTACGEMKSSPLTQDRA